MKKNNKISISGYYKFFITLIIIHVSAYADYKQDPKYGNGQNSGFINAMYGESLDFTAEEMQQFNHSNYRSNYNKYFLRIGGNSGSSSLSKLKNVSSQGSMVDAVLYSNKQKFKKNLNLEIAIGYKYDNKFSNEFEIFFHKNLKYASSDLLINQNVKFDSVIKSNIILFNTYYNFLNLGTSDIFVGAGLGFGLNTTKSKFEYGGISNIEYNNKSSFTGAYNLLIGCKFKIISQVFIKTSMRYTNLVNFKNNLIPISNIIWKDQLDNIIIQGNRKFFGFSLSFIHIFV